MANGVNVGAIASERNRQQLQAVNQLTGTLSNIAARQQQGQQFQQAQGQQAGQFQQSLEQREQQALDQLGIQQQQVDVQSRAETRKSQEAEVTKQLNLFNVGVKTFKSLGTAITDPDQRAQLAAGILNPAKALAPNDADIQGITVEDIMGNFEEAQKINTDIDKMLTSTASSSDIRTAVKKRFKNFKDLGQRGPDVLKRLESLEGLESAEKRTGITATAKSQVQSGKAPTIQKRVDDAGTPNDPKDDVIITERFINGEFVEVSRAPRSVTQKTQEQSGKFRDILQAKKAFNADTRVVSFRETEKRADNIETVLGAIDFGRKGDSLSFDDRSVLTDFAKILEPNAVRRFEAESLVANQSFLQRVGKSISNFIRGGELTVELRQDVQRVTQLLFDASQQKFLEAKREFDALATETGLPQKLITTLDTPVADKKRSEKVNNFLQKHGIK